MKYILNFIIFLKDLKIKQSIINLIDFFKDELTSEYIDVMFKPFDITKVKVIGNGILATIISAITALIHHASNFSVTYLGISGAFLMVLLVTMIADIATGLIATSYTHEEKTSKKGRRIIYKTGAYIYFIYVAYGLYKEVANKEDIFSEALKYFHIFLIIHITFWELFSVDENLKKMEINLGITDFLTTTYEHIKNIFKSKNNKT